MSTYANGRPRLPVPPDHEFGSPHHANGRMKCSGCGVAWPCQPFLDERQRVDDEARRLSRPTPTVVYPEQRRQPA